MSRPSAQHSLPIETESPADRATNGALDILDTQVRLLIELGAEPQLRARLERLLPAASPAGPEIDPLALAGVLTVCRQLERFKLTGDQHGSIGTLKRWALEALERQNAKGGTP